MTYDFGSFNNWGALKKVALRTPDVAFHSDARIDAEWQKLNYHSRPDLTSAKREFTRVEAILGKTGADVIRLPEGDGLTLDSLYTHDALIVTPRGLVRPHMGKPARRLEPRINGAHLESLGIPVIGEISAPGLLEGGDLVWIDRHTLLAGIGYRTNQEGLRQLAKLAGPDVEILAFDMPHYKGRSDVFHLMSCLSPLDRIWPLSICPSWRHGWLNFWRSAASSLSMCPMRNSDTMGCNVLALGPRHAMMVEGNPETEKRMRAAGVNVEVIKGYDICRKGEGGPTCMTRPLVRA